MNKTLMPSYLRGWRGNNKETIAIQARQSRATIRLTLLNILGGKCVQCGFSDERALHIDHIQGGGSREVAGGQLYNRWHRFIRNPVDNLYQILCANCNEIKRKSQMEQRRIYR